MQQTHSISLPSCAKDLRTRRQREDQRSENEERLLVSPSWQSDGPGRAYLRSFTTHTWTCNGFYRHTKIAQDAHVSFLFYLGVSNVTLCVATFAWLAGYAASWGRSLSSAIHWCQDSARVVRPLDACFFSARKHVIGIACNNYVVICCDS